MTPGGIGATSVAGVAGVVGVVGCTGAVGRALVRRLPFPLRLGGRDPDRVRACCRPGDEPVVVDIFRPDELARFCAGCDLVVNCAGPSSLIGDTVAVAALAAGADYVDVAGDHLDLASLEAGPAEVGAGGGEGGAAGGGGSKGAGAAPDTGAGGRVVLLGAGMMPGLSAALPKALAAEAVQPNRLVARVGGLDRFTPAAAADFVASLDGEYATPLAAWRGGPVRNVLRPVQDVEVPYFPGRVSAHPYLSRETERLARELGLAEVDWWGVFDGERTLRALTESATAGKLELAARLDAVGREPYFQLVLDLDGAVLVVRAADSYELTAAFAATAARAVTEGRVPPGAHHAADVLDPAEVLAGLRADPALDVTTPADQVEEGVL